MALNTGEFIKAGVDTFNRLRNHVELPEATKAINGFSALQGAAFAPLEFAGRMFDKEESATGAFMKTFLNDSKKITLKESLLKSGMTEDVINKEYKDKMGDLAKEVYDTSWGNINKGKVVGGGVATMMGVSAASGLIHDSNGNTDIAGIPFI